MMLLALMAVAFLVQAEPEADRLLRPSTVALDHDDRPVDEVVRSLVERTGVPMTLFAEDPKADHRARRVTLKAPAPVPFWEAVDRLEPAAGLILDELHGLRELRLWSGRGTLGPVCYDRVFRCRLVSLEDEREWTYGAQLDRPETGARRVPFGGDGREPGTLWERFAVRIEAMSEPRPLTSLVPAAPPKIVEAVDDGGRSLIQAPDPKGWEYPRKYYRNEWYAGLVATLHLKSPDPASRSIRRLKGAFPVVLRGARDASLTIPLDGCEGRVFRGSGVVLKVVKWAGGAMTVELRPAAPPPPQDRRNPLFDTDPDLVVRNYAEQFEWLDAAGGSLPADGRSSGYEPGVTRATIRVKPGQGGGPPDRLRFRGLIRVETEIGFEFRDIPLP